jgi:hypothetical protein
LRVRNRAGCDVYIQPYMKHQVTSYADVDHRTSETFESMRADGLAPCVVLQASPRNLQAWLHI